MGRNSEPTTIDDVTCDYETENAISIVIQDRGGTTGMWIPKSQIHDDSEVYEAGTRGKLIIPEWLAVEKGLV